ncbi:hypothetical protein [Actinomadura rubrisoli]|uniref:Uncharacterized protein n=1 Tax=Actinomadura rubrisoli TaxID=2530368 RepID=A0A4R5CDZ8_9ACTN|nr:hypothetical protein [Actinomadura rubrisoli]TDD97189.1 hypothetical protein E1298_01770 [Actinomadura rubrisoli]
MVSEARKINLNDVITFHGYSDGVVTLSAALKDGTGAVVIQGTPAQFDDVYGALKAAQGVKKYTVWAEWRSPANEPGRRLIMAGLSLDQAEKLRERVADIYDSNVWVEEARRGTKT